jgi:hypothetical protein
MTEAEKDALADQLAIGVLLEAFGPLGISVRACDAAFEAVLGSSAFEGDLVQALGDCVSAPQDGWCRCTLDRTRRFHRGDCPVDPGGQFRFTGAELTGRPGLEKARP